MGDFGQNTITNRQAVLDYIDANSGGGGGSQDLASVLNNGNTSGTNDIIFGIGQGLLFDNTSRLKEGTTDAGTGGLKGIAQICSIGYELKWEAGRLYVMEQDGFTVRWSLYNFSAPGIGDDSSLGYVVGSRFTVDNGETYVCSDATAGAAVWSLVTSTLDYTEYFSYVTQNSTSDPVGTIAKNDTGYPFLFDRTGVGEYLIIATGAFPDYEKVLPVFNSQASSPIFYNVFWNDANSLGVQTWNSSGVLTDGLFIGNLSVKIYI